MAITLGKNGTTPICAGIISVSVNEESELIDVTNRTSGNSLGYKQQTTGLLQRLRS